MTTPARRIRQLEACLADVLALLEEQDRILEDAGHEPEDPYLRDHQRIRRRIFRTYQPKQYNQHL